MPSFVDLDPLSRDNLVSFSQQFFQLGLVDHQGGTEVLPLVLFHFPRLVQLFLYFRLALGVYQKLPVLLLLRLLAVISLLLLS